MATAVAPARAARHPLRTLISTTAARQRPFSATARQTSKLGRMPIFLPPGVEVTVGEPWTWRSMTHWKPIVKKTITIQGQLGTLKLDIPNYMMMSENKGDRTVQLSIENKNEKEQKEMWGTSWAYLNNHIRGVSEGHTAILRLVGVGYRAVVSPRRGKEEYPGQRFLCLKLGFTHPVEEGVPQGVKVTTPTPTRILAEGTDREAVMSFAGRVRKWRPPEPYKGKGIFINDQTIKLKAKKIK
ncbi:Ribosomal protein L6 [Ophiocordyceps camponoti-floridani]|uniref:Ribosomal protein L6 n=1 Tax=Ophiocordyceps camponoti-floridani TaxID=2030778 RepID=A0A8H4QE83_9HYPO|nr:Ribosomal protein L6 [Ophiocordyceps camponoti-floridani]